MSSPIARKSKNFLQNAMIKFHQKASHGNRREILSKMIVELIDEKVEPGKEVLKCVDLGCGDMTLAEEISKQSKRKIEWICLDLYDLPEDLKDDPKWAKYRKFNGNDIPFDDKEFDLVIILDVLHHCMDVAPNLLKESGRVSKNILLKDHFEYGAYSRQMLRAMDFVGNWAYGVSIPDHYWTQNLLDETLGKADLQITEMNASIKLYDKSAFLQWLLKPKWQFMTLISGK